MSPFLAWGDFHARSRFARSTIPEEKWGTTRSLKQNYHIWRISDLPLSFKSYFGSRLPQLLHVFPLNASTIVS